MADIRNPKHLKLRRGVLFHADPCFALNQQGRDTREVVAADFVRIFNDRGSIVCKAIVGTRARPGVVNGLGVWWRKLGGDGRNVNELTHQRLTDIGRGPSFYDCLVEVEPAPEPART